MSREKIQSIEFGSLSIAFRSAKERSFAERKATISDSPTFKLWQSTVPLNSGEFRSAPIGCRNWHSCGGCGSLALTSLLLISALPRPFIADLPPKEMPP